MASICGFHKHSRTHKHTHTHTRVNFQYYTRMISLIALSILFLILVTVCLLLMGHIGLTDFKYVPQVITYGEDGTPIIESGDTGLTWESNPRFGHIVPDNTHLRSDWSEIVTKDDDDDDDNPVWATILANRTGQGVGRVFIVANNSGNEESGSGEEVGVDEDFVFYQSSESSYINLVSNNSQATTLVMNSDGDDNSDALFPLSGCGGTGPSSIAISEVDANVLIVGGLQYKHLMSDNKGDVEVIGDVSLTDDNIYFGQSKGVVIVKNTTSNTIVQRIYSPITASPHLLNVMSGDTISIPPHVQDTRFDNNDQGLTNDGFGCCLKLTSYRYDNTVYEILCVGRRLQYGTKFGQTIDIYRRDSTDKKSQFELCAPSITASIFTNSSLLLKENGDYLLSESFEVMYNKLFVGVRRYVLGEYMDTTLIQIDFVLHGPFRLRCELSTIVHDNVIFYTIIQRSLYCVHKSNSSDNELVVTMYPLVQDSRFLGDSVTVGFVKETHLSVDWLSGILRLYQHNNSGQTVYYLLHTNNLDIIMYPVQVDTDSSVSPIAKSVNENDIVYHPHVVITDFSVMISKEDNQEDKFVILVWLLSKTDEVKMYHRVCEAK